MKKLLLDKLIRSSKHLFSVHAKDTTGQAVLNLTVF